MAAIFAVAKSSLTRSQTYVFTPLGWGREGGGREYHKNGNRVFSANRSHSRSFRSTLYRVYISSRETPVSVCVVLKLIPLRDAKHFKPRPQSFLGILLKISFEQLVSFAAVIRVVTHRSSPLTATHSGRDPFNQNFGKFRSKTEWIGSVQPEKFRKKWSTFRGRPLFSVGPVRSKWIVPFGHSDAFSIPGPRCSVSSMYKMEENPYHCTFMDC